MKSSFCSSYQKFSLRCLKFFSFSRIEHMPNKYPSQPPPTGTMSSIRDPIKQEENVKTRTWNNHFITDICTLVQVQHEAFHAMETLHLVPAREQGVTAPALQIQVVFHIKKVFPHLQIYVNVPSSLLKHSCPEEKRCGQGLHIEAYLLEKLQSVTSLRVSN